MNALIIILAVLIVAAVLLVIWMIATYNGFIRLKNKIDEAWAAMDVSLKKRWDLVPNVVETVKGYAKHESETLAKVTAARNSAFSAATLGERIQKDQELTGSLHSLFALSESYPDLKASAGFQGLQEQLSRMEEEIAGSRRYYNAVVNRFNTKLEMFPGNIIGGICGFERRPLYELKEDKEREAVKVSF